MGKINICRFNELTARQLYEIMRCRAEVFVVGQNIAYQDLDRLDFDSTHVFIEDNDRILSYLRVIDPGAKSDSAVIGRVLTVEEARRKGLARQLMLAGIDVALKLSPTVRLDAQSYLKQFYLSLGFRQTSNEFLILGIPHIEMEYNCKNIY